MLFFGSVPNLADSIGLVRRRVHCLQAPGIYMSQQEAHSFRQDIYGGVESKAAFTSPFFALYRNILVLNKVGGNGTCPPTRGYAVRIMYEKKKHVFLLCTCQDLGARSGDGLNQG